MVIAVYGHLQFAICYFQRALYAGSLAARVSALWGSQGEPAHPFVLLKLCQLGTSGATCIAMDAANALCTLIGFGSSVRELIRDEVWFVCVHGRAKGLVVGVGGFSGAYVYFFQAVPALVQAISSSSSSLARPLGGVVDAHNYIVSAASSNASVRDRSLAALRQLLRSRIDVLMFSPPQRQELCRTVLAVLSSSPSAPTASRQDFSTAYSFSVRTAAAIVATLVADEEV